jgi:hypothetical protein
MPRREKRGKPNRGFPRFSPRLENANTAIPTFPQGRRLSLFQSKRRPGTFTNETPCSIQTEKSIKKLVLN